jgi:hypothetical protein
MKFSCTLLAATAALILAPATSFAAKETFEQVINVTATVPNAAGLVVSDPTGWTQSAVMSYNATTSSLNPVGGNINLKSPAEIKAHLSFAPALTSAGAGKSIPLKVLVDNVALESDPAKAKVVAAAGQATNVKPVNVKIDRADSTALTAGNYTGVVNLMFESTIP